MGKGDYSRAVVAFERFLQFFPEDKRVPNARLLIARCYMKAKDYESARKILNEVMKGYKGTLVGGKALFLMGESYYEQGLYEEAERYFRGVVVAYSEPELRDNAVYRIGWIQMQTGKWHEASETFKNVGAGSPLFSNAQDLSAKSLGGELLPYKDPTTAGATVFNRAVSSASLSIVQLLAALSIERHIRLIQVGRIGYGSPWRVGSVRTEYAVQ